MYCDIQALPIPISSYLLSVKGHNKAQQIASHFSCLSLTVLDSAVSIICALCALVYISYTSYIAS